MSDNYSEVDDAMVMNSEWMLQRVTEMEEEFGDEYPMDAEQRVAEMENDLNDISFETNSERNRFCNKYEKALREAGYDEDDITDKIEGIQNGTMTREDLCDYYGCDDDELDDAMDDDCRDYDD